jgi:hypothetical protein
MDIDPRLKELYANALNALPHLEHSLIYQIAFCHLCKKRGLVFVCYKNYKVGNCT